MPLSLSVVIPTHQRPATLRECLRRLERQTIADQLEVIVISDGPDAATSAMFVSKQGALPSQPIDWKIPIRYFAIEKSQQGMARNRGVREAKGEVVLFIGDDILLERDACERHVMAHKKHAAPIAVLGFVTWDPDICITPVMRWLERTGWQFGYPLLKNFAHEFVPNEVQHRFTYTSHISLPLQVAQAHPFAPTDLYGWEDIEWGMRLRDAGVKLWYEPDARALHHHRITMEDSLKRMETIGKSAALYAKSHEDFDRLPRGWKLVVYRVLSWFPTMRGRHARALLRGICRNH